MSEFEKYMPSSAVKARYGDASDMWLYRRQQEPDFPKPIAIGGRKFWKLSEIEAFERASAAKPTARPDPDQNRLAREKAAVVHATRRRSAG